MATAREALDVAPRQRQRRALLRRACCARGLAVLDDDPEAAGRRLVEAEALWERIPDLPASDVGHMLGAIVAANLADELLTLQPLRSCLSAVHCNAA